MNNIIYGFTRWSGVIMLIYDVKLRPTKYNKRPTTLKMLVLYMNIKDFRFSLRISLFMVLRDVSRAIMLKSDMKINSPNKYLTDFEEASNVYEYKILEAFSANIIVYGFTRCDSSHYV